MSPIVRFSIDVIAVGLAVLTVLAVVGILVNWIQNIVWWWRHK